MNKLPLFIVLILVLALASCAPSIKGSSSFNAYSIDDSDRIMVNAGETWYASEVFSFREFNFSGSDFATAVTRSPSVGQRLIASAHGKLALTNISVPEGWSFRLSDADAVKVVTKVDSRFVYYNYTIEATTAIKAPVGTEPGIYKLSGTLRASTGRTQDIPLNVTVMKPSTE